jgi:hypothetical protein
VLEALAGRPGDEVLGDLAVMAHIELAELDARAGAEDAALAHVRAALAVAYDPVYAATLLRRRPALAPLVPASAP